MRSWKFKLGGRSRKKSGQWWQHTYEEVVYQPCLADFFELSESQVQCADAILLALARRMAPAPVSNDVRKVCFGIQPSPNPMANQDCQLLWDLVFNFPNREWWNTRMPIPCPELPGYPTYKEVSLKLGYFKRDLPPGVCPHSKNCQTTLSRKKHEPAFLRPKICTEHEGAPEIHWVWSDSSGELANLADVQPFLLGHDVPLELAQAIAIWHRDEVMGNYMSKWNKEMAVYWARCRLMNQISQERGDDLPQADFPSEIDLQRIRRVDFCEHIAARSSKTSDILKTYLEEERLMEVIFLGNLIREEMGFRPF